MSTRMLALSAVMTTLVALPASAGAATFTVDQGAAAGCAGTVCKTIGDAVGKVADGDTIEVKPSATAYSESPLVITKKNVTISAAPGTAVVTLAASAPAGSHVFTLSGDGDRLKGLVVSVQANGGNAVRAAAKDTVVEDSYLAKTTTTTTDVPTYEVAAGATGKQTLSKTVVLHTPGRTDAGVAPAVQGLAGVSLGIADSTILSGAKGGSAVVLPGNAAGTANTIVRSSLQAQKAGGNALEVTSASSDATAKLTRLDSSILVGGSSGAGLRAESFPDNGALASSSAGDIKVELLHATIAGAANAVQAAANANGPGLLPPTGTAAPAGSIDITADRSIVHGQASVTNFDGDGLFSTSNTAKLSITGSDTGIGAGGDGSGSSIVVGGNQNTADTLLFADFAGRNLHLRADSPAKDKAVDPSASASQTDIDGDPRKSGPAPDLGADEFVNRVPVAKIKASATNIRQNQQVTFDASDTIDAEKGSGGSIKEYRWNFGNGQTATTAGPQVTTSYPDGGVYYVTVTVVDNFDAVSAPSEELAIGVFDGVAPRIKISSPRAGQRLNRFTTTKKTQVVKGVKKVVATKRVKQLRFFGSAVDDSGVALVAISVRLSGGSTAPKSTCRFLDAKKNRIVGSPCGKPLFFTVSLSPEGIWSYRTKKTTKLRAGSYLLTARAVDKTGVVGSSTIRFTVK